MTSKTFYITTPIYYVNDVPHIGHAYTTIAADVMARFKRLAGFDVWFLTGTDEHGQKIERMAAARGQRPGDYAGSIAAEFKKMWEKLCITNDDFIRTTEERHGKAVQAIFQKAWEAGDIYKGQYEGWYCTPDETFLLESQLIDGKCPACGRPVEWLKEESYFFRMSKYQDRLVKHIEDNPEFIQPISRRNEMINFVKGGLEDLCVSRTTFEWGIPVPFDPKHIIYVWFDALSNYVTALGYPPKADPAGNNRFEKYWPADVHLMGKEIVRFHSVIWPAMLMSVGLPLPKQVFGHGWWTVEGQKMSKSLGNVIDPGKLVDEFGVDAVRYFLLREVTFGIDGDFSRAAMIGRINSDLANDLGNLVSRTTAMIEKYFGGEIPAPGGLEGPDLELRNVAKDVADTVETMMDNMEFTAALTEIWKLTGRANKYVDEMSPWDLAKSDATRSRLATVMYNLAESLRITAIMLSPFMPFAPVKIWSQLGLEGSPEEAGWQGAREWGRIRPGTRVRRGQAIFPRIETKIEAGTAKTSDTKKYITIEEFKRIDLRAGTVIEAARVEGADRLLRLAVDLGTERRQIVAGIAQHYTPESLVGRQIVVVANLEPAKLKGLVSEGMLLAASTRDKGRLSLVTLDRAMPPGSGVS